MRLSQKRVQRNRNVILTHPARAGRASLTTDHARNCLYAHVHKSIHQMLAYLEQLALFNHHEYIIAQTYLIVCACDVIPNITSLFCRDISELLWQSIYLNRAGILASSSRREEKLSMTRAQRNESRPNAFSMHYFSTRLVNWPPPFAAASRHLGPRIRPDKNYVPLRNELSHQPASSSRRSCACTHDEWRLCISDEHVRMRYTKRQKRVRNEYHVGRYYDVTLQ